MGDAAELKTLCALTYNVRFPSRGLAKPQLAADSRDSGAGLNEARVSLTRRIFCLASRLLGTLHVAVARWLLPCKPRALAAVAFHPLPTPASLQACKGKAWVRHEIL